MCTSVSLVSDLTIPGCFFYSRVGLFLVTLYVGSIWFQTYLTSAILETLCPLSYCPTMQHEQRTSNLKRDHQRCRHHHVAAPWSSWVMIDLLITMINDLLTTTCRKSVAQQTANLPNLSIFGCMHSKETWLKRYKDSSELLAWNEKSVFPSLILVCDTKPTPLSFEIGSGFLQDVHSIQIPHVPHVSEKP